MRKVPNVAKISSARGKGYWSVFKTGFTVALKSPHMRIFPFFFSTGTMGVAHSLCDTLDMIPSFSRWSSSVSTFDRSAYGTERLFKNTGRDPSLPETAALISFNFPSPSLNTSGWFARTCCSADDGESLGGRDNDLMVDQSNWVLRRHERPNDGTPPLQTI